MRPRARTRARALAGVDVRLAATLQWQRMLAVVEAVPDEAFAAPTRLGDWTVAELVAHLARGPAAVTEWLAEPAPPRAELTALDYLLAAAPEAAGVDARAREAAQAGGPATLRAGVVNAVEAARAAVKTLGDAADDRVVPSRLGPTTLTALLATRVVEAVVHLRDLQHAVPDVLTAAVLPGPTVGDVRDGVETFAPQAVQLTVRLLVDALAQKAPGRSVEVRVTDRRFRVGAAVQCVEGPRHTRGTPPAVVEVGDALVWCDLATGRLGFAEEVERGRVSASGERADLTPFLPVLA